VNAGGGIRLRCDRADRIEVEVADFEPARTHLFDRVELAAERAAVEHLQSDLAEA